MPEGIAGRSFLGAACLCGIGDTVALLMADQAFPFPGEAAVAKMGVLIGSTMAAVIGTAVLVSTPRKHLVTSRDYRSEPDSIRGGLSEAGEFHEQASKPRSTVGRR